MEMVFLIVCGSTLNAIALLIMGAVGMKVRDKDSEAVLIGAVLVLAFHVIGTGLIVLGVG